MKRATVFSRLADRLILQPSQHWIDPEERRRELIPTPHGEVEAWVTTNHLTEAKIQKRSPSSEIPAKRILAESTGDWPQLMAIKFPGTAGRAERGGPHPFEVMPDVFTEIWTINPLGYGGSEGQASLLTTVATCDSVWRYLQDRFPDVPKFVIGNSLGSLSALYLAANHAVRGVYLRNPLALRQMIIGRRRYNWWNFGLARLVANQIPPELDSIANSRRSKVPLLLVRAEQDRVSPAIYQQLVFAAYAGPKTEFVLRGVDHHESVPADQQNDYQDALRKYLKQIPVNLGR